VPLKLKYQFSLHEDELMTTTLHDFTKAHNFSDQFRFLYLSACIQSYGASATDALNVPIGYFFWVEDVANSCLTHSRTAYRSFTHGCSTYVEQIVNKFAANAQINLMLSSKAVAIRHSSSGTSLLVQHADGTEQWKEYDHVHFRKSERRCGSHPVRSSVVLFSGTNCVSVASSGKRTPALPSHLKTFRSLVHMDVPFAERRLQGFLSPEGCWRFERYTYLGKLGPNLTRPMEYSAMLFPNTVSHVDKCVKTLAGPFRLGLKDDLSPDLIPNNVLFNETWRPVVTDVSFWKSLRSLHAVQGLDRMWFAGGSVVVSHFSRSGT